SPQRYIEAFLLERDPDRFTVGYVMATIAEALEEVEPVVVTPPLWTAGGEISEILLQIRLLRPRLRRGRRGTATALFRGAGRGALLIGGGAVSAPLRLRGLCRSCAAGLSLRPAFAHPISHFHPPLIINYGLSEHASSAGS